MKKILLTLTTILLLACNELGDHPVVGNKYCNGNASLTFNDHGTLWSLDEYYNVDQYSYKIKKGNLHIYDSYGKEISVSYNETDNTVTFQGHIYHSCL